MKKIMKIKEKAFVIIEEGAIDMVFFRTSRQNQSQSDQGPSDPDPDPDPADFGQALAASTAQGPLSCSPPYQSLPAVDNTVAALDDIPRQYLLTSSQLWLNVAAGTRRRCPRKDDCTDPKLPLSGVHPTPMLSMLDHYTLCRAKPAALLICYSPRSSYRVLVLLP